MDARVKARAGHRSCCRMCRQRNSTAELHAEASCEVLYVLPGDAAGTGAARRRPFQCLAAQIGGAERDLEVADIALDHRHEFVLTAAVEAEPEPEAVRQRDLLLDGLAWIDCGRTLVL